MPVFTSDIGLVSPSAPVKRPTADNTGSILASLGSLAINAEAARRRNLQIRQQEEDESKLNELAASTLSDAIESDKATAETLQTVLPEARALQGDINTAFAAAVADGVVTPEEQAQLDRLNKSYRDIMGRVEQGLASPTAARIRALETYKTFIEKNPNLARAALPLLGQVDAVLGSSLRSRAEELVGLLKFEPDDPIATGLDEAQRRRYESLKKMYGHNTAVQYGMTVLQGQIALDRGEASTIRPADITAGLVTDFSAGMVQLVNENATAPQEQMLALVEVERQKTHARYNDMIRQMRQQGVAFSREEIERERQRIDNAASNWTKIIESGSGNRELQALLQRPENFEVLQRVTADKQFGGYFQSLDTSGKMTFVRTLRYAMTMSEFGSSALERFKELERQLTDNAPPGARQPIMAALTFARLMRDDPEAAVGAFATAAEKPGSGSIENTLTAFQLVRNKETPVRLLESAAVYVANNPDIGEQDFTYGVDLMAQRAKASGEEERTAIMSGLKKVTNNTLDTFALSGGERVVVVNTEQEFEQLAATDPDFQKYGAAYILSTGTFRAAADDVGAPFANFGNRTTIKRLQGLKEIRERFAAQGLDTSFIDARIKEHNERAIKSAKGRAKAFNDFLDRIVGVAQQTVATAGTENGQPVQYPDIRSRILQEMERSRIGVYLP